MTHLRLKYPALLATLSLAFMASGCMYGVHDSGKRKPGAEAKLYDGEGHEAGYVVLTPQGDNLAGVIDVHGFAPGLHGMHIHAVGKCEGPDFKSAGGHLNPDMKQHGFENPMGAHQGDLPELSVTPAGTGHGVFTAHTTLPAIFDADGGSFVVHAAPDDNKTDPSGNSGARMLCGVLTPMGG
jgi:Cu-Zn family superoxide dismutase